jgi:RHS repeat-associated protein
MRRIKFIVTKLLFATCFLLLASDANATDDPPLFSVFDGAAGDIIADPTGVFSKETKDLAFYDLNLFPTIANPANDKITNVVSLFINEGLIDNIKTDFTAQVTVKIDYTLLNGSTGSIPSQLLEISYTKAGGLKYNVRQTIKFDQCRKVKVTILSISTPVTSWVVWNVLRIENQMLIKRDYVFDNNNYTTQIPPTHATPVPGADELFVSWNDVLPDGITILANGKTHIDLEWTWVDEEALDNYKKADVNGALNFDADLIFKNNSTRITVESKNHNSYAIPLIYDGLGRLFYRIRPVQLKEDGQIVNGAWSADGFTGLTAYVISNIDNSHQNNLNWQTTTSFAEEGKRKTVVQYFDGTLRGRQTVTKDNVTNKTVVAESFYDYQGRPTINILPAPTMSSVIKYTADFNKFMGSYVTPKDVFDIMPPNINACNYITPKLDPATGASKYYSPSNPESNIGFNKFIPDANGYAYTETRYTPDGTGRIEAQGGVGETHQLGKDIPGNPYNQHDTKYFYGKPDQKELDALFGTEAGDATHYSKNMVRDANGQYSVSYVDMHGRTVATALAGIAPPNVKKLDSYLEQTIEKNLLSPTNNIVQGRSVVSSTSLIVTKAGDHVFHYKLDPLSADIVACNTPVGQTTPPTICYDCYYDLEIRITGGCNVNIVKTATNLTFNNNGVPVVDQSCTTQPPPIELPSLIPVVDFTINLPEGEYNITKTLTVNKPAQDWYRDNVFNVNNICKKLEDFYKDNYAIMLAGSVCEITCVQCTTALGTFAYYRSGFLAQQGYTPQQIADVDFKVPYEDEILKSWTDAMQKCTDICSDDKKNVLGAIRDAMLDDMTPDQGQYARLNFDFNDDGIEDPNALYNVDYGMYEVNKPLPFNIFNQQGDASSKYKNPSDEKGDIFYKDELGKQDPDGSAAEMAKTEFTPEEFSKRFKSSWANALIKYHPEYCKLQILENTPSIVESYKTDALMEDVDEWSVAAAAGLIYPNNGTGIMDNDPFFNGVGAAYKPLMQAYINANFRTQGIYNEQQPVTLWKMAWMSVFCINNNQTSCALGAPIKPSQFAIPVNCPADWNYVWRAFRSLYLSEKERMINLWLDDVCQVDYNLLNAYHYERRFGKPEDYYNANLKTITEKIRNNNPDEAEDEANNQLKKQYEDNCDSYKAVWIKQLLQCDQISVYNLPGSAMAYTFIDGDGNYVLNPVVSDIIIGLKDVCEKGSDVNHAMGSSTTGPLYVPSSFQQVIKTVFQNHNPPLNYSTICHEDLIDFPPPYDKQAPVSDKPVVLQKEDCLCTRLTDLNAEKNADPVFPAYGNLSAWLLYKHGLTVRQTLIDSLVAGCSGQCTFYDPSFTVPAIFSCQTPIKNCIECTEYNTLKAQFITKFPVSSIPRNVIYPVPQNDDELNSNRAFAKFMNNKTGFTKTWAEYLEFDNSCNINLAAPLPENVSTNCNLLNTIRSNFYTNYYTKPSYTINRDANGCDISAWQFFRNPAVVFKDLFNNGIVSAPLPGKFHFDYNHAMCVPDSFKLTFRMRMLNSSLPNGYLYMAPGLSTTNPVTNTLLYFYIAANGITTRDACDACPGGNGSITTNFPALTPNVWRDVTIKFRTDGQISVYLDGVLVQQRTSRLVNIASLTRMSFQTYGLDMELDNVKVDNANINNNEIIYNETFANACQNFAIINPKFDCAKQPCDIAFKNYYNQQRSTNLTYAQIQNIYLQDCNIQLDACSPPMPYPPARLCGLTNMFPNVDVVDTCNSYLPTLALNKATEQYKVYLEDKKDEFENTYLSKCLTAKDHEVFTVSAPVAEYHYTLYYYDQAGNLVKTVPPAGVTPNFTQTFLNEVKTKRANGEDKLIAHNLPTQYRYNALNQVTAQSSPDVTGHSRFWYDALGRLVVSQNPKQLVQRKFSYTKYDYLGRISEVGEKSKLSGSGSFMTVSLAQNKTLLEAWLAPASAEPNKNITKTVYDETYNPICAQNYMCQQNLRNRVSYTYVQAIDNGNSNIPPWETATFYTYDIHGNVEVLLQDYNTGMGAIAGGNRYKKITYKYDLISGKVNEVAYQPGNADAFYHKYEYDAENKLTQTYTSKEYVYWEKEADYKYYRHGPMARTVLGQLEVQGVDYAYTIQGWLKGVNTTALQNGGGGTIGNGEDCGPGTAVENLNIYNRLSPYPSTYVARNSINFLPSTFESNTPDNFVAYIDPALAGCGTDGTAGDEINSPYNNAQYDMGQDGKTNATGNPVNTTNPGVYGNNIRTTDAYGYSLNYFNGDYNRIDQTAANPFAALNMPLATTGDASTPFTGNQLFNGNIGAMVVGIPRLGATKVYAYNYDQLNRITNMFAFNGFNGATNTFTPIAINDYKEAITYDANGNILTYKRNGVGGPVAGAPGGHNMDDLAYEYITNTNKLKRVTDNPAYSGNYPDDIDNQTDAENYVYDEIGNLIQDKAEGITSIEWTVYGKISKIIKVKAGATTTITYTYDASGNRISKNVVSLSMSKTTYYVRDASGNVMSVYENGDATVNNGQLTQTELHMYGSSRLGVYNVQVNVQTESRTFISMPGVKNDVAELSTFTRGNKFFELSNHLQNVLVTVSDKKLAVDSDGNGTIDYYNADVISATDYYPGGMQLPGRSFSSGSKYRYGFNGKENDKDAGEGIQDYGMRIYDCRLGRWYSTDNVEKATLSPYQFSDNNPLNMIDPDGGDEIHFYFEVVRTKGSGGSLISSGPLVRIKIIQSPGADKFFTDITYLSKKRDEVTITKTTCKEMHIFNNDSYTTPSFVPANNPIGIKAKGDWDAFSDIIFQNASLGIYLEKHDPRKYGNLINAVLQKKIEEGVTGKVLPLIELVMIIATIADAALEVKLLADRPTLFNLPPGGANGYGMAFEKISGGNLPPSFPVIDKFVNETITSIKAIDLARAKTYKTESGLYSRLKGDINKLINFEGGSRAFKKGNLAGTKITIVEGDYKFKVLELNLQRGAANSAQKKAIEKAKAYAKENNIELKINYHD